MTWLRSLDELTLADLHLVGPKAYHLAMLKQQGLPVAEGWVLVTDAWHQCLDQMPWAELGGDRLTDLQGGDFRRLQQTSQQWQQAMQSLRAPMACDWQTAAPDFVPAAWMLRASLWVEPATPPRAWGGGEGLLSAWVEADIDALAQMLPQFWSQALTARCLLVWLPHCQRLRDLCLATLITPIYPAVLSGTLTLSDGHGTVTTVAGLGQALTQGEAIPARCQVDEGRVNEAIWQSGFQERLHQLRPTAKYRIVQTTHQTTMAAAIQLVQRDRPDLPTPLDSTQLTQLLTLGETAQRALAAPGVRLEWLLSAGTAPAQPTLIITQADSWQPIAPDLPGTAPSRSQPTLVPMVSTVVQGIGASAGRMQGLAVVARRPQELPQSLTPGSVVVLPDLQPDAFLQLDTVGGLVIEQGGATCHAAILAREMGIPAVVGAPQATQLLDSGMVIWLDGDRGLVYGLSPESAAQPQVQRAIAKLQTDSAVASPPSPEQRSRYRQLRTKVMVNLSQTRRLATLPWEEISGVGLLRSEWLLLDILEGRHPWDWVNRGQEAELQGRVVQQLEPILQALGSKPLRYRSLDLRSHEWQGLVGSPPVEPNPMLGLRGTLSYEIDCRLFEVELAALATLQRAGYTNLQLILPFVRTVEEVIACRQPIERSGLTDHSDFALWIMAEVPSVLFLLPAYAQAGVQGIAIGSNDLTQLLLAIDRDQPIIASAYDERHPVVRLAMGHLVQEAKRCGLLCSICGQAPVRHPELIADLVAWGISSISVEAAALPFTLEAVWQAEMGKRG